MRSGPKGVTECAVSRANEVVFVNGKLTMGYSLEIPDLLKSIYVVFKRVPQQFLY
jgi:hypothetical protein